MTDAQKMLDALISVQVAVKIVAESWNSHDVNEINAAIRMIRNVVETEIDPLIDSFKTGELDV